MKETPHELWKDVHGIWFWRFYWTCRRIKFETKTYNSKERLTRLPRSFFEHLEKHLLWLTDSRWDTVFLQWGHEFIPGALPIHKASQQALLLLLAFYFFWCEYCDKYCVNSFTADTGYITVSSRMHFLKSRLIGPTNKIQ